MPSINNKKKKNKKKQLKKPAEDGNAATSVTSQQSITTQGNTSVGSTDNSKCSTSSVAASSSSASSTVAVRSDKAGSATGATNTRTDWSAFAQALCEAMPPETPTPEEDSSDSASFSSEDDKIGEVRNTLDEEMEPGDVPIMSLPAHMRVIEVEYRINRILRRENEATIMLPIIERFDESVSPPVAIYNSDRPHPEDCHRRTTVLLSALRWRKPALHRRISAMLKDYNRRKEDNPPTTRMDYKPVPGAVLLREM